MKYYLLGFALLSAQLSGAAPDIADASVRERVDFIQQRLDDGAGNAKLWWWGWLGGYAGLTAGQMAFYFATPADTEDNKTTRDIMLVGAASSLLGVFGQILTPMTPAYAGQELRAIPDGTAAQRIEKLGRAEKLLIESAEREEFGRSWIAHGACVAVNLGAGLVIWQGMHHDFSYGLANFAAGMLISEIQIFTQPMQAVRDLAEYRKRYGAGAVSSLQKNSNWFLQMGFTNFRVGIYF